MSGLSVYGGRADCYGSGTATVFKNCRRFSCIERLSYIGAAVVEVSTRPAIHTLSRSASRLDGGIGDADIGDLFPVLIEALDVIPGCSVGIGDGFKEFMGEGIHS